MPKRTPKTPEDFDDESGTDVTPQEVRQKERHLINLLNEHRDKLARGPGTDIAMIDIGITSMLKCGIPRKEVERIVRELIEEATGPAEGAESTPVPVASLKKPRFH